MDKQERLLQLVALKLSGEASAEELEELSNLLISDPEAGYTLEMLQQIWNPAANPGEEPDWEESYRRHRELHADDFDALSQPALPERDHKRRWFGLTAMIAASILTGVLGIWLYRQNNGKGQDRKDQLAEITVNKETRTSVVLPDGTIVHLNSGSRLTYDKEISDKRHRSVFLNGEGYFEVSSKKEQDFIIHTKMISIQVLGTDFNVRAYEGDPTTEATLIRGKIAVSLNNMPGKRMILNPNEKFLYTDTAVRPGKTAVTPNRRSAGAVTQTPLYAITKIEAVEITHKIYNKDTAWLHDQLIFKNETFGDILPELEKRYDVDIELENPRLAAFRYTAILQKESLEQVLKAMQLIKPFKYTIISKKVIIE